MSNKPRVTRSVTAEGYECMDGDENKKKKVLVTYYSPTTAEAKAERQKIQEAVDKDPNTLVYYADQLQTRLKDVRDFDKDGSPGGVILTNNPKDLDEETMPNIALIKKAIEDDINPKSAPASSQNG